VCGSQLVVGVGHTLRTQTQHTPHTAHTAHTMLAQTHTAGCPLQPATGAGEACGSLLGVQLSHSARTPHALCDCVLCFCVVCVLRVCGDGVGAAQAFLWHFGRSLMELPDSGDASVEEVESATLARAASRCIGQCNNLSVPPPPLFARGARPRVRAWVPRSREGLVSSGRLF
jgi:hypothetical protein